MRKSGFVTAVCSRPVDADPRLPCMLQAPYSVGTDETKAEGSVSMGPLRHRCVLNKQMHYQEDNRIGPLGYGYRGFDETKAESKRDEARQL